MKSKSQTWLFFLVVFFFSSTQTHLCFAADTISSGQSLTSNQTLISKGGKFELGFFTPELKLLEDGDLVLFNSTKQVVWSTNTASKSINSSEVVLGDDGNLVLRNVVEPSTVSWQSFDYPTDTWLPGAKLRYDNITRKAVSLSSWKNPNDPGRGLFSDALDPNEDQQQCDVYAFCGAFGMCNQKDGVPLCKCLDGFEPRSPEEWISAGYSGGCVRKTSLQCGVEDGFRQVPYRPLGSNNLSSIEMAEDCKLACLNNCSCNAYAFNAWCLIWNGNLFSQQLFQDELGVSINLRIAASDIPSFRVFRSAGKKPPKAYIIVLIAGSSFISILTCVFLAYIKKQRGKTKYEGREISLLDLSKTHEVERGKLELQSFDFNVVSAATNNFSNKLGQGGFGPVYKGKLLDESEIAVKRLLRSSGQGVQEFKNELVLISKLQHRNLVRLLGFCIDKEEMMLLYEYMPNKSLDAYLFDPAKRVLLDWSKRFNIVDGIARGLLYLHRESRLRVIHQDLKASNILLDEDMNPKISDFGMARIFGGKQTLANTTRVVGTYGYMSPEYAMEGIFSEKSDVFSFGVLLLEIVSSKKNNSFCLPEESYNNLIGFLITLLREKQILERSGIEQKRSPCTERIQYRCIYGQFDSGIDDGTSLESKGERDSNRNAWTRNDACGMFKLGKCIRVKEHEVQSEGRRYFCRSEVSPHGSDGI
ncbi:hypothetical protein IFM89_035099 [Coptis chinensis]|uniref:Receptor-like serine/threonine-protein kinase n=1 Tax=Coptis chinensis TaxID=261450 RepID=A0A835IIT0_9MAGN|nr:hypothetical protein IFM89_035099 [Coptis chinensis]